MEEAWFTGFSGGFEQGKLETALLELETSISSKPERVKLSNFFRQ